MVSQKQRAARRSLSVREYEKLSLLIIIACDRYKHPGLKNLRCAVRDGKKVAATFTLFGFRVHVQLFDEEVTRASIDLALNSLMKEYLIRDKLGNIVSRIGRLYILFAGHGAPDHAAGDGSSFFCPHDFDPEECVGRARLAPRCLF